jgi:hypothetical protein
MSRQPSRLERSLRSARESQAVRGAHGFSLVETLVASAITLVITGAIFALVSPAQGLSQAQPDASDMQQRMRVSVETLYRDLAMAGAGPYHGSVSGSLARFFAPVLPYRAGRRNSDPINGVYYRTDAITLIYVPTTSSQTTIRDALPDASSQIGTNPQANCPAGDEVCGFREGMSVLVFDQTGAWDSFKITQVQGSLLRMEHRGQTLQKTYAPGSAIVEAEFHTYYLDQHGDVLRQDDGLTTDVPVADDVVGLQFTYYGDPNPPPAPKPEAGTANCLFDASGNPVLARLPSTSDSVVELTPTALTDGPWCGRGAGAFDADLLRIRQVRVSLRVQAASAALRGSDPSLFRRPGTARGNERFIPDFSTSFDVSPRNLQLTR